MSEAQLCPKCSKLKIQLLPQAGSDVPGFKITTLKDLYSSPHCPLCRLFRAVVEDRDRINSLQHSFFQEGKLDASQGHKPIILTRYMGDAKPSQGSLNMSGFDVRVEGSIAGSKTIELYSPEGSPAVLRNDIKHRDLCFAPIAPSPSTIIKRWLDKCLSTHNNCSVSFGGDLLPDKLEDWPVQACRLVQIIPSSAEDQTPKVHLVQTNHQALRPYVTLSHCWGTLERRPIRTLKANLHRHLDNIPWQDLPKTFKDACALCAELGIRYIWIDSLCIVQDDVAEWEAESAVMGRIYEEALFTIAASSAMDASGGLFDVREKIDFVQIPYEGPDQLHDSPVYAFIEPTHLSGFHLDRDTMPLNTRAWVMQEAIVSRRIIHFTKNGLVWSCSQFYLTERDNVLISRLDVTDWHELVMRYSVKDLTYKSDKLHAIRGLANGYATRYGKTYYHGVFIEDLPSSLRWTDWFTDATEGQLRRILVREAGSDVPSWSWASVTGKVEFLDLHVCREEELVCGNFRALGSGRLGVEAPVKEIEGILGPFPEALDLGRYIEELRMADLAQELDTQDWEQMHYNRYILQDASEGRIGQCCFDEQAAPMNKIFFMAIHRQKVRDWWMPQKETKEEKLVWGLVLSRGESSSAFERVGYGHILDTAWIVNQPWEDIVLI